MKMVILFIVIAGFVSAGENVDRKFIDTLKSVEIDSKILETYPLKYTQEAKLYSEDDSWKAILILWFNGQRDIVELLWWKKNNQETRKLIIALFWCQHWVPLPNEQCPTFITRFDLYAKRFNQEEQAQRLEEVEFVKKNHALLASELYRLASKFDSPDAKLFKARYKAISEKNKK